jgi:hypothetical protein
LVGPWSWPAQILRGTWEWEEQTGLAIDGRSVRHMRLGSWLELQKWVWQRIHCRSRRPERRLERRCDRQRVGTGCASWDCGAHAVVARPRPRRWRSRTQQHLRWGVVCWETRLPGCRYGARDRPSVVAALVLHCCRWAAAHAQVRLVEAGAWPEGRVETPFLAHSTCSLRMSRSMRYAAMAIVRAVGGRSWLGFGIWKSAESA